MSKTLTPPFFASKIMNLLLFFDFERKRCLYGICMGFVWDRVGRLQFMHFLAIFAMLVVLATSVTPCYPL